VAGWAQSDRGRAVGYERRGLQRYVVTSVSAPERRPKVVRRPYGRAEGALVVAGLLCVVALGMLERAGASLVIAGVLLAIAVVLAAGRVGRNGCFRAAATRPMVGARPLSPEARIPVRVSGLVFAINATDTSEADPALRRPKRQANRPADPDVERLFDARATLFAAPPGDRSPLLISVNGPAGATDLRATRDVTVGRVASIRGWHPALRLPGALGPMALGFATERERDDAAAALAERA
jgi:hypothetical protein